MFRATDAALIRAATYPSDLKVPDWPDLACGHPADLLGWLREVWELPGFADAVTAAAPQFADRITKALAGDPEPEGKLRRLTETAVRYLLRWTTRATPFGSFAGIAPAGRGPRAVISWDGQHRDAVRPAEDQVSECTGAAESDMAVLRSAKVMVNALGYQRGQVWVLPCARTAQGRIWDTEITLTDPVRLAIQAAASPIGITELATRLARDIPAPGETAEHLVAALVGAGVLVSEIRAPMTMTDPAGHLARHARLPKLERTGTIDRRIGCEVTLPPPVIKAAEDAAAAMTALAPPMPGWAEYHRAFIDRWGPGAAVPLREVLNALGMPAGFRGSHRRCPPVFTTRDRKLAALAQQAALEGCAEIILDDPLIAELRGEDDRPPVPHTELRFTLAAATAEDLDRGAFTLTVVSGSRHAGVTAGRFLHLLTPAELARFRDVYQALPPVLPGASLMQLSGPPLPGRLRSLARVPELLPVLPAGDFHPAPPLTLADLAVAGDGQRLWLVSLQDGNPVEPLLFNCVLLDTLQQPLIRFLTEIWAAWSAPCSRLDWSHAADLPFLPRIKRGRTVLHPARWMITTNALPGRTASWQHWRNAWHEYHGRRHIPLDVLLGSDDTRLRLDLNQAAHLTVLRSHLDRQRHAVLTEAPGPAGWIDDRPAEILLTLTRTAPGDQHQPARTARPATTLQHRPGLSPWLEARLCGNPERILNHLAAQPATMLPEGWWFIRYPDPAPHLRLRLPLRTTTFAQAAARVAEWATRLEAGGLLTDHTLGVYRPETRHGTGPVLAAAEAVFAADSRTVLRSLSGDRQAATAAGMLAITRAYTGDTAWLATCTPRHPGPRLDPAQLTRTRAFGADEDLAAAVHAYRELTDRDGMDHSQVLAGLLHLHHARMIGPDTASERHCLRLARAIARTDMIQTAL